MDYWIVVVDDDPDSLKSAQQILGERGMKVNCFRSGKRLLRFMEKNDPDLILLDIKMPEMSGIEFLEAFESKDTVPVVMITGHGDVDTADRRRVRFYPQTVQP